MRLTGFVLRHKRLVVLAWLVIAVAGFATISKATSSLSATFSIPGQAFTTDSTIQHLYHNGGFQNPPVVLTAAVPPGTAAGPATVAEAGRLFAAAARAVPGSRLADQATTGDARFSGAGGQDSFALVFIPPGPGGSQPADPAGPMGRVMSAAAPAGWQAGVSGLAQLEAGTSGGQGTSTLTETLLGGLGALLVLAFVFASFIALLPLLMAAVAIPATFLLVYALTQVTSVNFIVQYLIALIGLGVAIDYSLLVVTRWRENHAAGLDNEAAVSAAMGSAGRAVVFSGTTVAISLLALVALPVAFLRGIGLAAFFIPLTTVAVAITLLPVLLASIGPTVDRPRLRREVHASRPWTGWARLVLRHRAAALAGGLLVVAALVIPLFSLRLGEPASKALAPGSSAQAALTHLESRGIPRGIVSPIDVLTTAGRAGAVARQARQARQIPGIYSAFTTAVNPPPGGTGLVEILPVAEPGTAAGAATLNAVQHALAGQPGVIGVGGQGPSDADFTSAVYGSFPLMLGLIAMVTLILLARAFRSLVLAAKAVIFNLASLGVAYGVMVLVWQQGHGSHALWSIPATGSITVYVPLLAFAFLFGLSMDYEVFILSRIREEYDATGSTDEAVVTGIGRTGRLVTSAALILFLAFLALSATPETAIKMLATALGAGILLDAIVIRSLLLPALIGVLGRWNWWLPAPAARILRVAPSAPDPEPASPGHQPATARAGASHRGSCDEQEPQMSFPDELAHALGQAGTPTPETPQHCPGPLSASQWEDSSSGQPHRDLGRPRPACRALADAGAIRGRALDAGSRTGEHALMCAGLGLDATGVDIASAALRAAEGKARPRSHRAVPPRDARQLAGLGESSDTVLDCGLLIFGGHGATFTGSLRSALVPGGRCFMLYFSDQQPRDQRPRRVRQNEITTAFAEGWQIDSIETGNARQPCRPGRDPGLAGRPHQKGNAC